MPCAMPPRTRQSFASKSSTTCCASRSATMEPGSIRITRRGRGAGIAACAARRGHRAAFAVMSRPGDGTTVMVERLIDAELTTVPELEPDGDLPELEASVPKRTRVISVLLVDDHPVVIEGLRKVLATAGDLTVTGEAHDASGAIEKTTLHPDVVLLDLRMPGASGMQATRQLRDMDDRVAIIILTSYGDQAYVRQALEAGADGYLLEHRAGEADRGDSARGPRPSPARPRMLDGVLLEFGGLAGSKPSARATSPPTIWRSRRASKGSTNREIGLATGRTEVAVKKRLQVIFQKLGAVDRAHAVAEAIRRGLI